MNTITENGHYEHGTHVGPVFFVPSRNRFVQIRGINEDGEYDTGDFTVYFNDSIHNVLHKTTPSSALTGAIFIENGEDAILKGVAERDDISVVVKGEGFYAPRLMTYIGYSVSLCIADILRGDMEEADIAYLVSGTKAESPEDWEQIIDRYRKVYWASDPDRGEAILLRLLVEDKVMQPRVLGIAPPVGVHSFDLRWQELEPEFARK